MEIANENDLPLKMGYCEMYEWLEVPDKDGRLGKFVRIAKNDTNKIERYRIYDDEEVPPFVLGVSTVCVANTSDDPDVWFGAYIRNEFGDGFLRKERLAVGEKVYDQSTEMNYIRTRPWEHLIPIPNKAYDKNREYVKRSKRLEWVNVNLLGKTIIEDNGECKAGGWCKPYVGKLKKKWGTAVPATVNDDNKFFVMRRLTDNTIIILNK